MGCLVDPPAVRTATTDFPEVCIEWLPTRGPGAPDGDWCDITGYVMEGKTSRGRQYEIDRFSAGSLSLKLVSTTRLFDPEYTTGPFYPYLIPMRQIRVSAVWNSVRYPIFRGYITDWGETVPDDAMFVQEITAKDAFVVLEQIKLPSSAWALEVVKDDPSLWFRLGETDTLRVTDSSDGGNYGVYGGSFPAQGLVINDADGAVALDHSPDTRCAIQTTGFITGYPFTFSVLFQLDGTDPAAYHVILSGRNPGPVGTPRIEIVIPDAPFSITGSGLKAYVSISDGTNTRRHFTDQVVTDGEIHHFVVTFASASSWVLYLDGVAASVTTLTDGTGAPTWPTPIYWAFGNYPDILASSGSFGFGNGLGPSGTTSDATKGILDELAIFDGAVLSATRVAALALAALTGWAGDTTGARADRFLDAIDWPDTLRDIEAGISTLGPAKWSAGSSALAAMQAWADTELGAFLIGTSGEIVWHSRHHPFLVTEAMTSQATFGDGHSSATLKYLNNGLKLPRDEALIRNPVQAGRDGGVTVVVKDQALIDNRYGNRSWAAPTSQDEGDAPIRDRAAWLLARFKELGSRLAEMQIAPRSNPSLLWPQVLGREISERITIKRTPLGGGNEIVTDQIIEGVEHTFSPVSWTTTFRGSPVDPSVGDYLILDDATYGLLDSFLLAY